jgi:hypothetical protein
MGKEINRDGQDKSRLTAFSSVHFESATGISSDETGGEER